MRRSATSALVVLSLVFALGCGEKDESDPPAKTEAVRPATVKDVSGHSFISTSVSGRELVPGTRITLRFSPKSLGIKAGCNSTSGKYSLQGSRLEFKPGPSTLMGCPEDLLAQDQWLKDFLASGPEAAVGDGTLELGGPEGESISLEESGPDPGI